jgi:hypothetical protein
MLDFFSLARGYGLALGFMMASLYYTFGYIQNSSEYPGKQKFYSLFFAVLAVLSNLILLNYFLSVWVLFLLVDLFNGRKNVKTWLKGYFSSLLLSGILLLILYPMIKILIDKKQFFYGGKTGFWHDTVGSLISSSFYFQSYPEGIKLFIECVLITLFAVGGMLFIYHLMIKKRMEKINASFLILLICILSPIIQFLLFKTQLPYGRTALYYIPLFVLLFVFIIDKISFIPTFKCTTVISFLASIILCISVGFHFYRTANLHYTYDWKYDADTKFAMEDLKRIYEKKGTPITIGIDWRLESSMRYYTIRNGSGWLWASSLNTPWNSEDLNKDLQAKPYDIFLAFSFDFYPSGFINQELISIKNYKYSELEMLQPKDSKNYVFIDQE